MRWENEIEKSVLHKRTNRRGNTEGSQRVEAKDNKKEMSGKLKTNDMKGNNLPQTRGEKKEKPETEERYIQEALSARNCFLSSSDKKHFQKGELN